MKWHHAMTDVESFIKSEIVNTESCAVLFYGSFRSNWYSVLFECCAYFDRNFVINIIYGLELLQNLFVDFVYISYESYVVQLLREVER